MIAISGTLVALLLAYCFGSLGGLVMGRPSRGLSDWNQSFLVGISIAATAFFPLSIALRGYALITALVCLAACGLLRLRKPFQIAPPKIRFNLAFLAAVLIAAAVIQFNAQNFRVTYLWDGYQIWATKALLIYTEGAMGNRWLAPDELQRLLEYPQMVPLYEALLSKLRGGFEWNALKPIFGVFYVSMLVSVYDAARSLASRTPALGATALLALLPAVSTRFSVGGYADMPQAALAAGVAAVLLGYLPAKSGLRDPVPWIIGGLMLVKNEGMILALVVCGTIGLHWLLKGRKGLEECRRHWAAIAIVFGCFLLRWSLLRWLQAHDTTYGPLDRDHFIRASQNLLVVPKFCLREMLNVSEWGLFWPAFFVAAIVVLAAGCRRERLLLTSTLAALSAYTSIFYFTNWPIQLHISQAYSRLLVQLSPAVVLVIVAAFARAGRYGSEAQRGD